MFNNPKQFQLLGDYMGLTYLYNIIYGYNTLITFKVHVFVIFSGIKYSKDSLQKYYRKCLTSKCSSKSIVSIGPIKLSNTNFGYKAVVEFKYIYL